MSRTFATFQRHTSCTLRGRHTGPESHPRGDVAPTFSSGFIVQLTNAKIILFDLSCYSVFVLPYSQRFIDLLPVTALLLLAGPGANLVWLLAGGAIKPFVSRYAATVSIVMAIALLVCAVMMLFI